MFSNENSRSQDPARPVFDSTHWSVVLLARDGSGPGRAALEELCQTYWYPLYAFVRRSGLKHHDAMDLTQGFLAELLEKQALAAVHPDKGRFRAFLIASLKNFMRNDWRSRTAQKRGGHVAITSIHENDLESRYDQQLSHPGTAEQQFERDWVAALLQNVIAQLRHDYEVAGRLEVFDALHAFLVADVDRIPQSQIAEQLGMTISAVKMSAHRMKNRFAKLLRSEIAATVANEEDVDDELNRLIRNAG